MKNILKIQITAVLVISLFLGALGFVVGTEQSMGGQASLPAKSEPLQAKLVPVSAKPLNSGIALKPVFSLQGANVTDYLIAQSNRVQAGVGIAENLQIPAPIQSPASPEALMASGLQVQPLHLVVIIRNKLNSTSLVWASGTGMPQFPSASQALVPALALFFLFIETRTLRSKASSMSCSGCREADIFTNFFQANRILRC